MIICFSCGPETKAQMDRLVATGHYADHGQVIAAAIQNLTVIHSELKEDASIIIDRVPQTALSGVERADSLAVSQQEPAASSKPSAQNPLPIGPASNSSGIPALFRQRPAASPPTRLAPLDIEPVPTSKGAPIDSWMFGQYNRLLPAKVTCRALINILAEGNERQPLEKLTMSIANEAAKLGRYLSVLDEKRHLGRDDAMAVAFPKNPTEFKSIQRFANQFVASANREGQLSGLAISLKLIGRNPDYPEGIALTEAGWNFGMMENPLLDTAVANNSEKFSANEIAFLVDHVATSVPVEAAAYRAILNEVAHGVLTPDALDNALSQLPGHPKKVLGPFVSTQRSGAICRMADLHLIGRSRTGTHVSYVLTPLGKDFLGSAKLASLDAHKSARV